MAACDFGVGTAANVCAAGIIGIFQQIKRYVRYVIVHKKNLKNFEEKMNSLKARRGAVKQMVRAAEKNLETIYEDVNHWFQQVDDTINAEEENVKELVDQAKAKCFIGLCPNIKPRYQLSRKAEEYVAVIDELLQQGQFDKVGFRDVLEAPISAAPRNLTDFASRKAVFDDIVEALKDSKISIIGVYGPGGVGKTTLVNEVARHVKETGLFCPVVVVTVTLTPNVKNIQERIAVSLGLELKEEDTSVRADLLSKRLENEKKILVVLDDIWAGSEVKKVGIPFGDEFKGCKILLTSRNRHVLTNEMDAKTTFAMDNLKENEAWDLFKKMAGNDFENSDLRRVAAKVAEKCAGLPLAIVTVARALKNKDLPAWSDALRQLERPSSRNFIPATVYSAIRLSYDNLECEELKQTFLLCCLLVHNSHVEELLRFAMGLHLFEGVNTVEATRDRVLTMVSNLKDSCLLLDDYKKDSIAMHDFVRDVAIAIARDNHAFVLRDGDVFEEWPDEEKMQNFKMICLSFASIQELPSELECPQLTLFSMGTRWWGSYLEMPPGFFEKMKKMEVLNLIQADSLSSGSSISFPISLRTLCLKRCRLGDIVSLGKLKNLEILCLSESNIERLPEETRQLTKLRSLDLTGCGELKIIPPGVLSSLSRLEELFMGAVIVGWNQEGNARLYELKELSRLTTLEICILDAEIVKENLLFEKLQRYKIVIGVQWKNYEKFENPRTIKLRVNTSINHLDDGFKCLLTKTESLYLEIPKGVEIVLNQVSNRDSTSVCQDELPLFGEEMEFPFLEDLYLSNINVVGRIWHNQFLTPKSLTKLEILDCDNLKYILSSSMAKSLVQLKCLEVRGCKRLREIILSEDIEEDDKVAISFPQLRTLSLQNLPRFIGFCSGNYKSTRDSEQALFDENVAFPQLEKLRLSNLKNCRKIWHDQFIGDSFSRLNDLYVWYCEKLLNVFPFNMSEKLQNLTVFEVQNCDLLEEIFEPQILDANELHAVTTTTSIAEETATSFVFSKLSSLHFDGLPKLKSFYYKMHTTKWPSLKQIELCECDMVEIIFASESLSFGELTNQQPLFWVNEDTFPNLEELILKQIPKMAWRGQFRANVFNKLRVLELDGFSHTSTDLLPSSVSFENLTTLKISSCHGIVNLIACSTAKSLVQLTQMSISDCEMIKEIIAGEGDEVKHNIVFARLKHLKLSYLPSLASFCLGKHNIDFPALEKVSVIGCPKMKIFSQGDLSTPMLHRVQFIKDEYEDEDEDEDEGCWKGNLNATIQWLFAEKIGFCEIEKLSLSDSSKWIEIWRNHEGILCFKSLTYLEVHDCNTLRCLFTVSIALDLPQLSKLKVSNCTKMEHVILDAGPDEEVENKIVFPQLEIIRLECCADLASFYEGSKILKCSSLKFLRVVDCPKMFAFASTFSRETIDDGGNTSSRLSSDAEFFDNKMELPFLKGLHLSNINVGRIWPKQFLTLKSLATLEIHDCDNLKDILSSFTAKSLAQLKSFAITGCKRLKEIIFSEDIEEDDKIVISFPQLSTLRLEHLEHFIGFCSDNYNIIFPSLKTLQIWGCLELKEFIYKSTIEDNTVLSIQALFDEKVAFPQLEELRLSYLKNCRKIWHDQLIGDSFSRLNYLFVGSCEKLLNVFPINMSEKLQNLTVFEVESCNLLEEIFEPQILDANELHAAAATPSIAEETATSFVFSKLASLEFNGLPKLKSFYYKMHTTKWPSLKKMKLWGCDMVKIIFASESLSFGELTNQQPLFWVNEDTFLSLEELNLKRIPRMAWHGQFQANVFSKLRVFELKDFFYTSIDLLLSSVSFENLTTLEISSCHAIVNLTACSTAKSLVQLTKMSINDCEMIEEIIAGKGDEGEDDIVFARLKHLKLRYLPSLASFCLGKHNFDFPALENVTVRGCPKMKIFSQGDLSTPMLQRVQFIEDEDEDEGCWEGNLNATIQWLFAAKVEFREIEKLSLSDSSKWIEIWKNPEVILSFKSLTYLKVHDCKTLRCLFTVSTSLDLPQLCWLEVKNCIGMEHIILDEGPDEEVENKIVFPRLYSIGLECCADLASFYKGSKILKYPSLKVLEVIDCPKMFAFVSTFSRETIDDGGNTLSKLSSDAAFFDNEVEFPQLTGLRINRLGNCKRIWHDHLIDDSFSNLIILWVWNCDKLQNVFSLNMSHRLQNLMEFKVENCDSLEEIFKPQVLNSELHTMTATESIVFASLEYLHLSYLPSLASFCSEKHNFEFPTLEKMFVRECPKMKIFCKGDLSAPELQKVLLTKDEEIWRWEGNLKATIQRLVEEMNVQNAEDDDEDENMLQYDFEMRMIELKEINEYRRKFRR